MRARSEHDLNSLPSQLLPSVSPPFPMQPVRQPESEPGREIVDPQNTGYQPERDSHQDTLSASVNEEHDPLITTESSQRDLVSDQQDLQSLEIALAVLASDQPPESQEEHSSSSPGTPFWRLVHWLPILAVVLALTIAQLSATDGPLNEIFVGRPWPQPDPTLTLKPIDDLSTSFQTARSSSHASTNAIPVESSTVKTDMSSSEDAAATITVSPIIIESTGVKVSPVPCFRDDFAHATTQEVYTRSAEVHSVSTGLGEALEHWFRAWTDGFLKSIWWILGMA